METLRIAILQCEPARHGVVTALAKLEETAARASAGGAALLITPEMYLTGYNIGADRVRALAQNRGGEQWCAVGAIAKKFGLDILVGGPELGEDGQVYNAAVFLGRSGEVHALYRKTHLYGAVDRSQFSAGDRLNAPFVVDGWCLAIAICYDIEFPELARAQAQAGVDALLVPTANMLPYVGVPTRLVPARAEENAVYVAYANYCGSEGEFDYCGLSCVCGPDGADLARAASDECLMFAELTKSQLRETRAHSTHLIDLRPELYGPPDQRGDEQ
jgi:predicted amidohydrolase